MNSAASPHLRKRHRSASPGGPGTEHSRRRSDVLQEPVYATETASLIHAIIATVYRSHKSHWQSIKDTTDLTDFLGLFADSLPADFDPSTKHVVLTTATDTFLYMIDTLRAMRTLLSSLDQAPQMAQRACETFYRDVYQPLKTHKWVPSAFIQHIRFELDLAFSLAHLAVEQPLLHSALTTLDAKDIREAHNLTTKVKAVRMIFEEVLSLKWLQGQDMHGDFPLALTSPLAKALHALHDDVLYRTWSTISLSWLHFLIRPLGAQPQKNMLPPLPRARVAGTRTIANTLRSLYMDILPIKIAAAWLEGELRALWFGKKSLLLSTQDGGQWAKRTWSDFVDHHYYSLRTFFTRHYSPPQDMLDREDTIRLVQTNPHMMYMYTSMWRMYAKSYYYARAHSPRFIPSSQPVLHKAETAMCRITSHGSMRLNASDLPSTILVPPNMTVYYVTGVNTELEYLASSTAWERRVIELMNELVQDMPQQYSEQYLLTQLYYVIKRIGDAHTLTLPAWVHDESAHPYLRKRAMKLLTYNTIGMAMSVNRYDSEDPFPSLRWSDDEDPAKDSIPEWGIRVIPTLTAPDQYIAPTRYTSTALFTFLANRSPAPQTLILFDGACKASTRPEYMNVIEYYEAKKAALAHGRSKLVLIAGGTRRGHRVPRGVGARSKRRLPDK